MLLQSHVVLNMYWPSEPNSLSSTLRIIYLLMVSVSCSEITLHSASHVDTNIPLSEDKKSDNFLVNYLKNPSFSVEAMALM